MKKLLLLVVMLALSVLQSPAPVAPPGVPTISSIGVSGTNLLINVEQPGISWLYYLTYTSTNLSLPFSQWTLVATNMNTNISGGNFTIIATNAVNPLASQQFYLLEGTSSP